MMKLLVIVLLQLINPLASVVAPVAPVRSTIAKPQKVSPVQLSNVDLQWPQNHPEEVLPNDTQINFGYFFVQIIQYLHKSNCWSSCQNFLTMDPTQIIRNKPCLCKRVNDQSDIELSAYFYAMGGAMLPGHRNWTHQDQQ